MGIRGTARWAWVGLAACAALAGCGGADSGNGGDAGTDLAGAGYRLSGTLSVPAGAAVDSDLNDVNQLGRTRNNDLATAQALSAPVLLVGSVNRPGTGPAGSNQTDGDTTDAYVLDLQRDDLVELEFAPGTTAEPADLDLYVASADGVLTGASDRSDTRYECVRITQAGRYYLRLEAFKRAAGYTLRAGPATTPTTDCTATTARTAFDPGELVAQARSGSTLATVNAQALVRRSGITTAAGPSAQGPQLLLLPGQPATRRSGLALLSGDRAVASTARTQSTSPSASPLRDGIEARLETLRYAKALQATGAYDYVQPNVWMETSATIGLFPPDDLHYGEQRWDYDLITLPAAINRIQALPVQPAQRPIIAVIDTGVMLDHPDLQPQLASFGRTFLTSRLPGDRNQANGDDQRLAEDRAVSHGTHVAGTAAAATFNGVGVAGVAPMARLMPLNVFGRHTSAKTIDILQAMLYAAGLDNGAGVLPARRADVINLSMGSPGACGVAFQDTINRVRAAGTLVVAAAGSLADNPGGQPAEVHQPANCAGVIAVGAVDSNRQLSRYANSGTALTAMAPGGDLGTDAASIGLSEGIFSTLVNYTGDGQRVAGVGPLQGSSMATPQVSGVLALMRYLNPDLSVEDIDALFAAGRLTDDLGATGHDSLYGHGLINARKAVDAALESATGSSSTTSGAATLGIRPARLDLGSLRSAATIDLVVTSGKRASVTATVTAVRSSSPALTLRTGTADPSISLNRQLLDVDRRLLPADGSFSATITLTLSNGAELTVPVTLDRPAGSASSGPGFGPVYVTLSDPDTGRLLHTVLVHASQGRYAWQFSGYRRAKVVVRAGADPNNDGTVCGPGEPCGAERILSLSADQTDLDLNLSPAPWGP
ncbi:S8 family serine peptidase [uncultured Sphaerotilus sp.]|uniref:S8 family serine peptidase n=1 Tax=uncultured Sphaerotilus sp. TaxID=474984 RepID=UPI0030CA4DC0